MPFSRPLASIGKLLWILFLVGSIAAGSLALHWAQGWLYRGKIPPSGGLLFVRRVELAVPLLKQNDPRWGRDPLGPSRDSLGSAGCAVASAAMVLAFYGVDTDPQRLNRFLHSTGGYTPEGWLYWEAAAELQPGRVRHAYEDLPSYQLIDWNLLRGNPVIVRLRFSRGNTHFVVIAGKDGYDYLTRDPGASGDRGLYPLRELGVPIEALRFYEPLEG